MLSTCKTRIDLSTSKMSSSIEMRLFVSSSGEIELAEEIEAPHWGVFLSPNHLYQAETSCSQNQGCELLVTGSGNSRSYLTVPYDDGYNIYYEWLP